MSFLDQFFSDYINFSHYYFGGFIVLINLIVDVFVYFNSSFFLNFNINHHIHIPIIILDFILFSNKK